MDDYNGNAKGSSRKRSWGSRNLIEFLDSLGRDISNRISENDVATILTNYIRENHLTAKKRNTKTVACDERLRLLFERQEINLVKLPDLVAKHYEQRRLSSSDEMAKRKGTIDAVVSENIKVLYLRKSLVQELAKAPETFESKVVGTFVRIKNPCQLVQVTGVKEGNPVDGHLLQVTNYSYHLEDVTTSVLSDDDFSMEECEELHQRMKNGFVKRLTVVNMEEKVRSLYEDVTKHCVNDDGKIENDIIKPYCEASFEAHQSDKEQQLSDSPVSSSQETLPDGENQPTLTASAGDKDRHGEAFEPATNGITHNNDSISEEHCDPTKVLWFYELPKGQTHGPFSITDLKKWNDDEYFAEIPDFKVWMRGESAESAVSLTKLLSYISKT
ncbi:hypothetical protein Bca101_014530 [Brassica carinata]